MASAIETVEHLRRQRSFRQALIVLGEQPETAERLRLERQCLAMAGDLARAAEVGERLLTGFPPGSADDRFRQGQILAALGRYADAYRFALEALGEKPDELRHAALVVETALAQPVPLREAQTDAAHHLLLATPPPRRAVAGSAGRTLVVPARLPGFAQFYGIHHAHFGLLDRLAGVSVAVPGAEDWLGTAGLPSILPALYQAAERLWRDRSDLDRGAVARYIAARLPSFLVPVADEAVDFLPAVPLTLGQRPWIMWSDNLPTLFNPLVPVEAFRITERSPEYWCLKALLESPSCRAVISPYPVSEGHVAAFFRSPLIAAKSAYIPPYDPAADRPRPERDEARSISGNGAPDITLLFSSSLNRQDWSFYYRGGVDVLNAFEALAPVCPNLRLILRTHLPDTLSDRLRRLVEIHPRIHWIQDHMPEEAYRRMITGVDLVLAPMVQPYRNGVVEAMQAGIPVLTSDVTGIEEFVEHEVSGVVVPGRRHRMAIALDPPELACDFAPVLEAHDTSADPVFFDAYVRILLELVRAPERLRAMGRQAARPSRVHYTAADQSRFQDIIDRAFQPAPN